MPMTIKNSFDGNLAIVTPEGKLKTFSTTETESFYISKTNGEAYTWSVAYDYAAADTLIWLRNDSTTKILIIETIILSSDTATQFILHFPVNATPAGTAVTGVNMNRGSVNVAEATCYRDETNNTQANVIHQGIIDANATIVVPVRDSFILYHNDCVAVDYVTAGTLGTVTIKGYYVDRED